MQRLEVSSAVRPIYGSLDVKRLITDINRSSKIHSFPYTSNSYFPEVLCLEGRAVVQLVEALC